MSESPPSKNRKVLATAVATVIVVAAAALGWLSVSSALLNPLSEDAVLQADVVHISTPVPGRLAALHTAEGGKVARGDLLFTIDDAVYRLRVDQARAELAAAKAGLAARERSILGERSNAAIAGDQIARARANLALAEQTLARLQPLARKGYVTEQQIDDASTLRRDAEISLKQAMAQAQAAGDLVGTPEAAEALIAVQRSALAIAERALADTQVRAPHNGRIVGLSVSTGEYVAPDQSLFTLINTDTWHASAFFRETELADIHEGSCATVYALASPRTAIAGRVESIGWGVSSDDMISLPRNLPYVQRSLNWVRVAQRFPVRVRMDDPPEHLMRAGASATVVIRHEADC